MKQCETPEEQGTGLQMGERLTQTRQERDRLRRQKKALNTDSKALQASRENA